MPERRWRKLRAVRSPVRMAATGPVSRARTVPGRRLRAFLHLGFKNQARIHLAKNPGGQRQAGHHQVLLGPDVGLALKVRRNQGLGGDVADPQVLFQGQVDEAVDQGGSRKDGHQSKSSVHLMRFSVFSFRFSVKKVKDFIGLFDDFFAFDYAKVNLLVLICILTIQYPLPRHFLCYLLQNF